MEERKSNCIGYAYFKSGITPQEEVRAPPYLGELLRKFERVESVDEAEVMAVGFLTRRSFQAIHMVVINEDKKTITHRRGYGEPITQDTLSHIFAHYKVEFGDEIQFIFLRRKLEGEKK